MKKPLKVFLSLLLSIVMILPLFTVGICSDAASGEEAAVKADGALVPAREGDVSVVIDPDETSDISSTIDPTQKTGTLYDLWVGGVRVTKRNSQDIFGDGKVSFDIKTRTLTLNDPTITDTGTVSIEGANRTCLIYSSMSDLTVTGTWTAAKTADYALYSKGGRVIMSGSFDLAGKYYAVYVDGEALTLRDGTFVLNGSLSAFCCLDLDLKGAVSRAEFIGSQYCAVATGRIILGSYQAISSPSGATIGRIGAYSTVVAGDGRPASYALIEPSEALKAFNIRYDLWVGRWQVTSNTKDNLDGQGKAVFDCLTDTLYLNDPEFEGVHYFDETLTESARIYCKDMYITVKGSGSIQSDWYGIYAEGGVLTVDGNLSISGGHTGIYASGGLNLYGHLNISGGSGVVSGKNEPRAFIIGGQIRIDTYSGGGVVCMDEEDIFDNVNKGTVYVYGPNLFILAHGNKSIGISGRDLYVLSGTVTTSGDYLGIFARNLTVGSDVICLTAYDNMRDINYEHQPNQYYAIDVRNVRFISSDEYRIDYLTPLGPNGEKPYIRAEMLHDPNTGYAAWKVVIAPEYPVWVNGIHLTGENASNIFQSYGTDPSASYDPETHTLTLRDPWLDKSHTDDNGKTAYIYAKDVDLNVVGDYHTVYDPVADFAIYVENGKLTVDGNFTFKANDTVIYATKRITLKGRLLLEGAKRGVVSLWGGLTFDAENLKNEVPDFKLYGRESCAVELGGGLFFSESLAIASLYNYSFDGYCLRDKENNLVKEVYVKPSEGLNLWLGEKEVTTKNYSDIYGDGTAAFDPDTGVLTLNNPKIKGYRKVDNERTLITAENIDLTIKGSATLFNTFTLFTDAIAVRGGSLTIDGDFTVGHAQYAYGGVLVTNGSLTVKGNVTVNTSLTSRYANGLEVNGGVSVEGNLTVSAGVALTCSADVYLNGGDIDLLGQYNGLYTDGKVYIKGRIHSFTATGEDGAFRAKNGYTIGNSTGENVRLMEPSGGTMGTLYYMMNGDTAADRVTFAGDYVWIDGTPCIEMSQNSTVWSTGTYFIDSEFTIDSRVEVNGSVTLILGDGANVRIPHGIHLKDGNELTVNSVSEFNNYIYIFSDNKNPNYDNARIGGNSGEKGGKLTLNGGHLNMDYQPVGGAGIGGGKNAAGGSVTLNGGGILIGCIAGDTPQTPAIGGGYGSSDNGILTLGEVKVALDYQTVLFSERMNTCRNKGGRVEVSTCMTKTYPNDYHTISSDTHTCIYCGGKAIMSYDFQGSGTERNPYLVKNTADWETLSWHLNNGEPTVGVYFKQTADISVSSMLGADRAFGGVYDGGGKTLDVAISGDRVAPIYEINGATIKNLKVDGSVTGGIHSAGLVSIIRGEGNRIENCAVGVNVTCSGTHCGGFVGHGTSSSATIVGCVFTGSITGSAQHVGTFWGWSDGASPTLINCFDASGAAFPIGLGDNAPEAAGVVNTYYLNPDKTAGTWREWANRGKIARAITPDEGLTLSFGDSVLYDVSGVRAYAAGVEYNGVFYAGEGDEVAVSVTYRITTQSEGGSVVVDNTVTTVLSVGAEDVKVKITIRITGDVNGDGVMNIADVTALLDLLSVMTSSEGYSVCDVDKDEDVNISDVSALLDLLATA